MSCSQYLEIDSTYRERNVYPNPSNFDVLFENVEGSTKLDAREPLTKSYPVYGWHGIQLSVSGLGTNASYSQIFFPEDNVDALGINVSATSGKERFSGGSPYKPVLNTGSYIQAGNMFNGSWTGYVGGLSTSSTTGNGVNNYFAGAMLVRLNGGDVSELSRIASYNPNTNTCVLESAFSDLDVATDNYVISYDFNPINKTNPTLHIAGGSNIDNYYTGNIVEDVTLMQASGVNVTNISATSTIISYNGVSRVATLSDPFDETSWRSTDNYIIRKQEPLFRGIVNVSGTKGGGISASNLAFTTINSAAFDGTVTTAGAGFVVGSAYSNGTNFTIRANSTDSNGGLGSFIIMDPGFGRTTGTTGISTGKVTINAGAGGAAAPTTAAVINITKTAFGISVSGACDSTNSFEAFPYRDYTGDFLYVPSRYPTNAANASNVALNMYPGTFPNQYPSMLTNASNLTVGTDKTDYGPDWGNFSPNMLGWAAADAGNASGSASSVLWRATLPPTVGNETGAQQILANFKDTTDNSNYIIVKNSYPNASSELGINPTSGFPSASGAFRQNTYFEILPYTSDGYTPLKYYGSRVSQEQEVCYEIELMELILPNQTLNNSPGGLLSFFSHVFVELMPFNSGNSTAMASNNPNSRLALFKVAIIDIPQKIISKFVRLDGQNIVNTIKFRPNESFHFRVFLPNGEDLDYNIDDNAPPVGPNPDLQISVLFRYKRCCK